MDKKACNISAMLQQSVVDKNLVQRISQIEKLSAYVKKDKRVFFVKGIKKWSDEGVVSGDIDRILDILFDEKNHISKANKLNAELWAEIFSIVGEFDIEIQRLHTVIAQMFSNANAVKPEYKMFETNLNSIYAMYHSIKIIKTMGYKREDIVSIIFEATDGTSRRIDTLVEMQDGKRFKIETKTINETTLLEKPHVAQEFLIDTIKSYKSGNNFTDLLWTFPIYTKKDLNDNFDQFIEKSVTNHQIHNHSEINDFFSTMEIAKFIAILKSKKSALFHFFPISID